MRTFERGHNFETAPDLKNHISDVIRAAPIILERKRTNLGKAVFLGTTSIITVTLTF